MINPYQFYLEWLNDYLTIQKMAANYGISDSKAEKLIKLGKKIAKKYN